jgi:hypothetical protein
MTLAETLEHLELPYLAYLTLTVARWQSAEDHAREYVRLMHVVTDFEHEHWRRWRRHLLPGLATLVLATRLWSTADEDMAVKVLESYLPLGKVRHGWFGGDAEDRLGDYRQDLRVKLLKVVERLSEQPAIRLLARLYAGDRALLYAPRAANLDFLNARKSASRSGDYLGEGYREQRDAADPEGACGGEPAPDLEAIGRTAYRDLLGRISKLRHTKTEKRMLEVLTTRPEIDPDDTEEVALAAGCSRKAVGLYFAKLRKGLILKGFLA